MANTPFQLDMSPVTGTGDLNLTPELSKIETLAKNKEVKLANLGQTTRSKFYDADTFYQGSQGVRLGDPTGAYAQAPEAPATIEKKFGRPATPQEVAEYETSMKVLDNYFAGVIPAPQEAIQGLLDQPLTPQEQTLYNEAIKQTPMGTAETTGVEGHAGRYGRQIAQVQVPGQEDTLQKRLVSSGIAPEKMGTSAFERLPSEYKSYSDLQGISDIDADGMIGESVDIAQSSLIQEWGKIGKVAAKAGRWIGESLGVDKETMEAIMPDKSGLFDESFTNLAKQEVADKMTGVMAKTREEQQAGMEAALGNIKDGDYGKAAWESIKILPYMLGDSAGEMAAIMAGTPGITMAVAARVNEDAEEYKKNNKAEPDTQWLLGSTLLNAGALFGEKFLVKSGIGSIIEKGVSKAKRTGGIAASAVGEATQEYYDQVQQEYMTQKEGEKTLGEIATSPEAQLGALAGGVMGGALRAAGEAGGAVIGKAKPAVGSAAGRIADEIDRRKAAKAEEETAITEAEKAAEPTSLSDVYGGEDQVRAKEAEYHTTIDDAIEKGDIHSAAVALKQYSEDTKRDTEELLDKNEFTARKNKLLEMVKAEEEKIVKGEADKESAQTFGSSPEMIDTVMADKTAEEAEEFLQTFSTNYGSEATERIQQHVEMKKSLADVGEDIAKDITAKAKAITESKTEDQRNNAIEDFERFQVDRSSRYGRLESWVKTLEQDLQAEANKHSDPKAFLRDLAASTNRDLGKKNSDHQYKTKGIHKTENFAYRSDIAKQLLKKEGRKHDKGVYEVLSNKEAELIAFNRQAELLGLKESAKSAKEAPITEAKAEETAPIEEATKEVVEPTKEVAPVVEEPIKVDDKVSVVDHQGNEIEGTVTKSKNERFMVKFFNPYVGKEVEVPFNRETSTAESAIHPQKEGLSDKTFTVKKVAEEPVKAVPTKAEILASVKELVDAKKFGNAKEIIDNSNLSEVAKKNLLKRIEYRKSVSPTQHKDIIVSDSGTVFLDVPKIRTKTREGFTDKDENHITIIGFKTAKKIRDAAPETQAEIRDLINRFSPEYTLGRDAYIVSKYYPEAKWTDKDGNEQVSPATTREAVVQTAEMPNLEAFYKELSKLLGEDIAVPFPHVTRKVKGHKAGIAINSKEDFDALDKLKLTKGSKAEPTKEAVKSTPVKEAKAPAEVVPELPPIDYGSDFLEVLRAELENDKAEEAELKASIDKTKEAINGFDKVLDQYQKDTYEISSKKAAISRKIKQHREEVKKFKAKIGIAAHRKELTSKYFNEGLRELNTGKRIATAAIAMMQGMAASMKKFTAMIKRHKAAIENYDAELLSLRIREEAIEDAIKETKKKKAEAKEKKAEDIEQIQGVQESIKAAEKELKNFVSKDIIANSRMDQWMQNVLVVKKTANKLASDPNAGIELLNKLSGLSKVLGRTEIEKIISDKFSNLVEKGVVTSKTAEQKDAADKDLARLLFDNNDQLHPNVVAAISKSLVEYLLKYGTNLMAQDPKQVAQMLGYGDNVEAMPAEALKLVGNKTFKKNVADILGKIIQNDIGIKVDPEAVNRLNDNVDLFRKAESLEEKFTASLGQIAAIIGGEIGIFTTVDNIVEENKLSAEQYAEIASGVEASNVEHTGIDMVGLGDLGRKLITSKDMYTTFNEIMEEYSDGSYLKEVRTRPIKDKEVKQKVDVEVFEPSDFNKETINNARKQNWRLDFAALDLFKETEEIVKKHLGYVPTVTVDGKETIPTMSYVDEQNQLAKNNSIDLKLRLLENLEERIKEEGLDTDLFFEYFYGSNGRYYLDNNEANPQNDTFNRFMLGLASNTVEVDLGTDSKSTDTFFVALAQAFGEDVDKMSTANAIKKGKEWLEKGSKTITEELKGDKFEPEAVGHALQGILAVQAFENSNGKPFKTNLVIETDAVTSGIILKTLQLPVMGLEKAKELLKKGGIVFKGDTDYDTFVGTNKLIEDGQLDLYRELAQKYSASIDYHLNTEAWAIQPEKDKKLSKRDIEVNERRARLLAASKEGGIMPEFSTDPDKIKGKLRAIFKPVVMVFGYGGGITSIKKKFVGEIIESLPTKLLAEITAAQTALKNGQPKPDMPILNFFKAVAPEQKITVSLLRKGDILDKKVNKYQTIRDLMMKDMDALYGSTLESALEEIFGPELVEANRKLNNSFRMMFRIFNHKYQKQLAEFEKTNGRKPIADEKAEMIIELQDSFPAVAPPFAKDTEKGIIVDSKTSGDTRIKAQTMGNFERGAGQKTISVAAVVKEFEEAISAGNVVPIHYIDASIMGTTFNNIPDITQIFDAIVSNVSNGFEANQEYNKQTIQVSKEYSLATKVLESLQQSIDTLSKEEKEAFLADENNANDEFTIASQLEEDPNLTFEDVLEEMTELDSDANAVRKELFSLDIKSDHMTGLEATVEIKGGTEVQLKVQEQEALSADLQQYGTSEEPAVETKSKNGILPSNKRTNKAVEEAINKECKQ